MGCVGENRWRKRNGRERKIEIKKQRRMNGFVSVIFMSYIFCVMASKNEHCVIFVQWFGFCVRLRWFFGRP